ncbi:VOC family protein, partial [Nocardia sp. NPDC060220]|uniref:VOC family protein n=1 Tax=Nocardia sp. NPDC060220 TaxID=3347076 RepID=UPI00364ACA01
QVVALGGRPTGERHEYPGEGVVVVMEDPEGHEFCLSQHPCAAPPGWPGRIGPPGRQRRRRSCTRRPGS